MKLKKLRKYISKFLHFFVLQAGAKRVPTTVLVNKIYDFCEFYGGRHLFPYQEQFGKRIIRSVLENDGAEITALFSRQSGKTETVALITGGMMIILPVLANMPMFADDTRLQPFKIGIWVGIYAPTLNQAQINYNRMRSFLTSPTATQVLEDDDFRLTFGTNNGNTVSLSNGSLAKAVSASEGSNIEGESHHLIICEEAQDISDYKLTKSIHPMGAAYNATIIDVGTATTFTAYFYRKIQQNKEEMKSKSTHIRNHFEYDCDVACKYNEKYRKYVEREKKSLGENSDEFQMSYKLKWQLHRGMLIEIDKFEQENTEPALETCDFDKSATHVIGIDLGGGEGGDSTVLTAVEVDWGMPVVNESKVDEDSGEEIVYTAYNTYIKSWLEIRNLPDYEEQYALIKEFISHFKVARVVCDATREKSVSDRLSANLSCEVIPYVFGPKSKSDLYRKFITEIDTGRARVPYGENTLKSPEYLRFIDQLGSMQKGYSGNYVVCSHPPIKGAHDDYVDSWALAVWGASYEGDTLMVETFDRKKLMELKSETNFQRRAKRITARRRGL